jgi:glycosyltransferase involved in cell wall biosynthesis
MSISVIILTFNSEKNIVPTLEAAAKVSDDIHIVDSYSTDKTLEICARYSVNIVQHEFINYGDQRNWAIDNLAIKYDWELHLDSDERLSDVLIHQLNALSNCFPEGINGYYIPRLVNFLGRLIKYGGMSPTWHMRLIRHGKGRCEERQYDQHFYVTGPTGKLSGLMIDYIGMNLSEWTVRHNRWSDLEVIEMLGNRTEGRIQGHLTGNPVQRKRFLRNWYNQSPLFVRPFLLFFYRYVIRLGFLCGKEGLIFFILQTFWFRFLIDAKLYEKKILEHK